MGTTPPGFQRSIYCTVVGTHYNYILKSVKMRLFVVMTHFGQVFTWYVHHYRYIVKTSRYNYIFCLILFFDGSNYKIVLTALLYALYLFKQFYLKVIKLLYPPVIFYSFLPARLGSKTHKRHTTNLQSFRSRKKSHEKRIIK